jgi:hypothetical protein
MAGIRVSSRLGVAVSGRVAHGTRVTTVVPMSAVVTVRAYTRADAVLEARLLAWLWVVARLGVADLL